jgi:hypothetical protein
MAEPEEWVVENYEAIVAEGRKTFDEIASDADHMRDVALAGWARKRSADAGENVTPEVADKKSVRSEK